MLNIKVTFNKTLFDTKHTQIYIYIYIYIYINLINISISVTCFITASVPQREELCNASFQCCDKDVLLFRVSKIRFDLN